MNQQRTRPLTRRTATGSRAADAHAIREAREMPAPTTMVETLPMHEIESASLVSDRASGLGPWTYRSREECIAEAAYLRAERRGFEPGYDLEDWLAAEKNVDAMFEAE